MSTLKWRSIARRMWMWKTMER